MTNPIYENFLSVSKQYSDYIIFFRIGDFFETYDEQAEYVSEELDIVLATRRMSQEVRVPMVGLPYHSAESYIKKLMKAGKKVAILEKITDEPINGSNIWQVKNDYGS